MPIGSDPDFPKIPIFTSCTPLERFNSADIRKNCLELVRQGVLKKIEPQLYLWLCFTCRCLRHLAELSICVVAKLHILVNFGPDYLKNGLADKLGTTFLLINSKIPFQR